MTEPFSDAEVVLDDELLYADAGLGAARARRADGPRGIVREGELLAGKYRAEQVLGPSGLSQLVLVRHVELEHRAVLKLLLPEALAYPDIVRAFAREAHLAVELQSEHLARISDMGRLDSGSPYLVREYLSGPDLSEVLKVRGPLPIAEAIDLVLQVCEGLAGGHALGFVHGNLRPGNIVLCKRPEASPLVKLLDFGAPTALLIDPFGERSALGKSALTSMLASLAPEQIRDPERLDVRSDIHGLGAVLFELLSGAPPHEAASIASLLARVVADPARSVRSLRAEVPEQLDRIVHRCMAKEPGERFGSAGELALALRPFAGAEALRLVEGVLGASVRRPTVPPPLHRVAVAAPRPEATDERVVSRSSIPALAHSWRPPEQEKAAWLSRRRLVSIAAVATFATLGAFAAVRSAPTQAARVTGTGAPNSAASVSVRAAPSSSAATYRPPTAPNATAAARLASSEAPAPSAAAPGTVAARPSAAAKARPQGKAFAKVARAAAPDVSAAPRSDAALTEELFDGQN